MSDPGQTPLRLVEGGSPEAAPDWEAVYRQQVGGVYAFLLGRTGNRADAEDLTTQVFLRALPRLRDDAGDGEVHGYLLATARSVVADHWRDHYGRPHTGLDEDLLPDRIDEPRGEDQAVRVERLLARLPERHRRVLELRFLRGYSVRETAEAMGITVANAKVLQLRALRRAAGLEETP